jgi:hypothetical protein
VRQAQLRTYCFVLEWAACEASVSVREGVVRIPADFVIIYFLIYNVLVVISRLCGVLVSVLATGPKGIGFEPGQRDGFLRAIKIRITPSFGWKVKPQVPCRKILCHVKDLLKSQGDE